MIAHVPNVHVPIIIKNSVLIRSKEDMDHKVVIFEVENLKHNVVQLKVLIMKIVYHTHNINL